MRQKPPVEVFDAPTDVSGIYPENRARRQRDLGAALIQFPRCRFSAGSESQGLPRRLEDRLPPTPPFESPAQQVQQDGNPAS
jgi:hypothetical protein